MTSFDDICHFISDLPGRLLNCGSLSFNRSVGVAIIAITRVVNLSGLQQLYITVSFVLLTGYSSLAQEQIRHYDIIYRGDTVGRMNFYEKKLGANLLLKFDSKVRIRSLFTFLVETEESSDFKNGALVHSSVRRKINGKEKTLKQTIAGRGGYQCLPEKINCGGNSAPIVYNLHLLYISEPADRQKVYSDHFQEYLLIQKIADHKYKVELPDGNYNYYSFENGVCYSIEVVRDLFSLTMQLKK
ncbi:MAG: hypothetical protein JNL51_14730 [Chitinophagaceae bacterium]|nr:hypothetical protein [Chitinophagaceae bacterium]